MDRRRQRRAGLAVAVAAMLLLSAAVILHSLGGRQPGCEPTSGEHSDGDRYSTWLSYSCLADPDNPAGVVVHLHGDGAGEFDDPGGSLSDLAAAANRHNMLFVAPVTPDLYDGATWWVDLDANVRWLRSFVDREVLSEEGVDPARVWWSGYSGGAEMISYGLLPRAPEIVTGGALLMGGGGVDRQTVEVTDPVVSDRAASLPLVWAVGEFDDGSNSADGFDALDAAHRGSRFYRDLGYGRVDLQVIEGSDHYDLPQAALLDRTLGR